MEPDGRLDEQRAGRRWESGSGGGFKETAVMLRRQLEEKGFSTMRECA